MDINDHATSGLDGLLGIQYEETGPARCVVTLDVDARHRQPYGLVHGGTYCMLVESAASVGAALYAMEHGMSGAVGVSNTTDFYRPHRTGSIRAVGTPIHQGRSQQVWEVAITRAADDVLLSKGQVRLHNITDPAVIGGSQQ